MGSRQWGHPAISSLLRVKIYDFAMYMDGKQVIFMPVTSVLQTPPKTFALVTPANLLGGSC